MLLRNTSLSFLFLLTLFTLSAQKQHQIDSLKILANSNTLNVEDAIKVYLEIARLNRRFNPEEQVLYAQKAYTAAKSKSDLKMQGISMSEIASYHQKQDRYDSAYYYYERTIPFFTSQKNIGNVYSRLSNIEKARGNYVESITLLIKSDSLFEICDYRAGRLANNSNLGILLSTKGDYEEAISYYKKAEELLNEKDERTKSQLYTNFAITYGLLDDIDNSKKYTEQSIAIKKKLNDINGLANAYGNLANIASKEGDSQLSIQYLEVALEAFKKMNNKNGITGCYTSLGNTYRQIGDFAKAKTYLLQANKLSEETKNHDALLSNHESLYKLFRDGKKWDKAYYHLESYNSLKDSITEIEKLRISKELQTKYETDRILKDKALAESNEALAEQKAETNKNYVIAIASIGALVLGIFIFLFYRFRTKKKAEVLELQLQESEKRLKLEQQTRISELKALQSQMNPHFVFNALNSIQDLILLQDIRNSNKYLGKFSDLIRRILNVSNKGNISISEELIMLKLYAELEQLRFGNQLQIEFKNEVSEAISDDFKLPPMFIQPYVENALKHGLMQKEGDKKISVNFYIKDRFIICKIDDNGIGRTKAEQIKLKNKKSHLGFSTEANLERVDLLNEVRKEKIKIEIIDKVSDESAEGTTVLLHFPYSEI